MAIQARGFRFLISVTPGASACLLLALSVAGCNSSHKGAPVVTGSAGRAIDPSWITATEACWPELGKEGYSADQIRRNLADLTSFQHAFPVYAAQTHSGVDDMLGKPLQTGPDPDTSQLLHSATPVLNRGQAAQGTGPQGAVVQHTDGIAPPDAFCSIQSGIPQGFSK